MEKKMKKNKGITLIALVITIIVLLILSAVTINLVLGQNGIIGKAQSAQSKTAEAEARDQAQLEWLDLQVETKGESVSAYAGKLNDEDKQSRDIKEVGSGYVVITKNGYDFKIYDNGTIEMLRKIDAKYIPTVTSKITTDAEGTQEVVENVESGTPLYIVLTINLQKGTVSSVTSAENIESVGTYVYKVTKNGTYTFTITTNERTDNKYTTTHTIEVSKFKIANMPENWTDASYEKTSWGYEYKDVETNKEVNANAPVLTSEMTPIKYVAGSTTGLEEGSKWANAMTPDGSMWVWIPRYAYKITNGYNGIGLTYDSDNITTESGTIEIKFLKGKTNEFLDGTGTAETDPSKITYTNGTQNEWLVHPTFTTNADNGGGWNEELEGIWVAKFEASGSTSTLEVKPNQQTLRNETVGTMWSAAKNAAYGTTKTTSSLNSHMIKNSEWGATAYLAHSKYGRNRTEISINNSSDYYTGRSAGAPGSSSTSTSSEGTYQYNTENGVLASTTGNVYGIYDMSGGRCEYVASYISNGEENTNGGEIASTINSTAYVTVYKADSTDTREANYNANSGMKGDAIYETSKVSNNSYYKTSWLSDYSAAPFWRYMFFARGENYNSGANAGIFCFLSSGGADNYALRPVLSIF